VVPVCDVIPSIRAMNRHSKPAKLEQGWGTTYHYLREMASGRTGDIDTCQEADMSITASELRRNVYQLIDSVLSTGTPLEIERGGRLLRIVAVDGPRSCLVSPLIPAPPSAVLTI
jgi:hypothetical protein